jgi:hypothetical protein
MHVSDDEIWAKRTEKAKRAGVGAWSREQLAAWGVRWPPPKGWQRRLNGGRRRKRRKHRKGDDEPGVMVTRARARLDAIEVLEAREARKTTRRAGIPTHRKVDLDVPLHDEDAPPWELDDDDASLWAIDLAESEALGERMARDRDP